jgi:hypothetical protein
MIDHQKLVDDIVEGMQDKGVIFEAVPDRWCQAVDETIAAYVTMLYKQSLPKRLIEAIEDLRSLRKEVEGNNNE